MMKDIIIIGGGPAGLTAAIYARRAGKTVLIIENNSFGGQITLTPEVENYPGFTSISGSEFSNRLLEQATDLGAETLFDTVTQIKDGKEKTVITQYGEYKAKTIIVASGLKHRKTGLEAEEKLTGRGVSYCAVCDGAFYKGKNVAVLGGGNTAVGDAAFLSDICKSVTIIHRRNEFRADLAETEKLKVKENIIYEMNSVITDIKGDNVLTGITVKNFDTSEEKSLEVSGLFVAIGQIPQNDYCKDIIELDEYGFIIAGEDCLTSLEGVFAAGDCRTKSLRQLTTAVADGAVSGVAACEYIDSLKN